MKILAGHDGSCPNSLKGVRRKSDAEWTVYPMWRPTTGASEEAAGRGYRFNVRAVNGGVRPARLTLRADWGSASRDSMHRRDIGFVRHETDDDWRMVVADVRGHVTTYRLLLQPGVSEIGLQPAYNTEACSAFVASLASDRRVRTSVAGRSSAGRPIHLVEFAAPGSRKQREQLVIQTRDHAYETAGNYCVEGMVGLLLSDDPVGRYFLQRFNVAVLPMTNPDGVHDGLSRLTAPRGADLNRCRRQDDAAWRTVKKTLDRLQPGVYINVHNWTSKWLDGLLCNSDTLMAHIRERMPSQGQFLKQWLPQSHADFLNESGFAATPPEHKSWKNYVAENFDAQAVTFEFPWFSRNAADMRATGRDALLATLAGYLQMKGA